MPSCKRVPLFRTHPKAPLAQGRSGLVAVKKFVSPPALSNSRFAVGNRNTGPARTVAFLTSDFTEVTTSGGDVFPHETALKTAMNASHVTLLIGLLCSQQSSSFVNVYVALYAFAQHKSLFVFFEIFSSS